nr:PREDICTED: uncharacterized protein LOC100878767 [Megachile rotundata]
MSRPRERLSRRWSTMETISKRNDPSSSEESSSPTNSIEYSPPAKSTSTPLRSRWSDLEQINRSPRHARGKVDDVEPSPDERRLQRHKAGRDKSQNSRRTEKRKERYDRHTKRKSDSEESENEKRKETSTSESTEEDNGEGDGEHPKRKQRRFREDNELPITEILRRSQENARTKYEQQPPFPVLTTDKIYVQHRDGFSAMKINQSRDSRRREKQDIGSDIVENQGSPPIRIAVLIQKFWKKTGLVYQGLLGGMALMHFIMLHIFFDASMEFVAEYSMISEIYASIFSLLVTLCIVSSFDKFDLARFDMEHLREIYLDYSKAVIAVPLYLITFCLHQVCAKTDNQLSLARYYNSNDSLWENVTDIQTILDDLNSWHKISMSKDMLAVFSWLFVSLGTKDDAFLIYLLSMEKYANDESGQ